VLSIVPGFGDLASPVFTVVLLVQGLRQRVPRVILARMVLNALIDALIGVVPIGGPVADIFWRANTRNLTLLERHARPGRPPERADYVFVFLLAAAFDVVAMSVVLVGLWLAVLMFA